MPKGYAILTEEFVDPDGMREYERASTRALVVGGAKVLAVDTRPKVLEGQWHGTRTVVLEFESPDAAQAWYDSPEYRQALPLRLAAARSNAVILTGFDPR
ncbi:DUF1330 domain-containing protein [Nocardia sp. BMG111209]|uniref:DUF1330 domain-containing protein n=1 Tax=Nocardia sp. BMG111209 TaxID=1160137 RepID=UPI00035E2A0A|nr:DUF1330 domain-containing protein [Nocardia sp. BMG111209]